MKFMVVSMQVPNLTAEQNGRLYKAMGRFYSDVPEGVTLECDYIRVDKLGSYSVLDVPDRETLDEILEPFDGLVQVEVVEVGTTGGGMG